MGQREVLKWASVIAAACFVMYAFLNHMWLFFLVGIPHGVIWSGFRTATLAWVGGYLPEQRRAEGFAFFGMAAPAGAALGPMLGVWLMPRAGFPATMITLAVIATSLVFILACVPQSEGTSVAGNGHDDALTNGVKAHQGRSWLIAPTIVLACMAMSYGPIPSYGAQEAVDHNFRWASALVSCYGFGMALLRLTLGWCGMGKDPLRLIPIMLAFNIAAALGLALMPGGLIRHIVCGAMFGASFGMSHTLVWAYAMGRAEPKKRGSAAGTLYFAYDVCIGLGSLIIGFPMEYWGYRWGWGAGALSLSVAWLAARRITLHR